MRPSFACLVVGATDLTIFPGPIHQLNINMQLNQHPSIQCHTDTRTGSRVCAHGSLRILAGAQAQQTDCPARALPADWEAFLRDQQQMLLTTLELRINRGKEQPILEQPTTCNYEIITLCPVTRTCAQM